MDVATGLLLTTGALAAFPLFVLAVLLLHEAAHAIVGALVGFHVVAIEIGAGPCMRVWWLAGVRIVWCRWPVHGLVHVIYRGRRWLRMRIILFALAGPLSTVALALVCSATAAIARDAEWAEWLVSSLGTLTFGAWVLAVGSLWPHRVKPHLSDVEQVVQTVRMRRPDVDRVIASMPVAERAERFTCAFLRGDAAAALGELERAAPDDWVQLGWRAILCLANGDAQAAMARHDDAERIHGAAAAASTGPRTRVAEVALHRGERALAINRAFFLVHLGTEPALGEARRLADSWGTLREAVGEMRVAALRTRGLVLLHTGSVALGMTCLRRALAGAEPYWLRALGMSYLAYGYALRGNEPAARRWSRRALALHPQSLLLPLRLRFVDDALAAAQAGRAQPPAMLLGGDCEVDG